MADLHDNMEALLRKVEEYFLIAKLATDTAVEQRYEQLAEELRRRITEAVEDGAPESLPRSQDAEPVVFPDALLRARQW
jgi:hypothetical protein